MTMNKSEFLDRMTDQSGLTKAAAKKALDALLEILTETLQVPGEKITLQGFGTFNVESRPARVGRNVRTGEKIDVPACRSPKFKASSLLKAAIRA